MIGFIVLQSILLFVMMFHDWIPVSPFNDISALKKVESNAKRFLGSLINTLIVIIPLFLTVYYDHHSFIPFSIMLNITAFYFFLTIGTIFSWWVPYFFGSSKKHKQLFSRYKNTHHFLPARGDHVVPNTLHVVLHLLVWSCLIFSIIFLVR